MKIKINEIFGPTIQGEGMSAGKLVLFIRTAMCNLHCIWCDTPYTWNWTGTHYEHPEKYDHNTEVHPMEVEEIIAKLYELDGHKTQSVVISGGEPLIQQKQLLPLLRELKRLEYRIEIETNGTVLPSHEFFDLVDQINCSPKLANSGDSVNLRHRPKVLETLARNEKVSFKFVISEREDINEVLRLVLFHRILVAYLMPEGKTAEELKEKRGFTEEFCNKYNFIYSDRLHITQLGGGRGV